MRTRRGKRVGVGRDEHFPFYQPYCKTCGWVGDETVVKRAAHYDADEHLIAMARAEQ